MPVCVQLYSLAAALQGGSMLMARRFFPIIIIDVGGILPVGYYGASS